MDALQLTMHDLGLLGRATGDMQTVAALVAQAKLEGGGLDFQIYRDGPGYLVILRVLRGEGIIGEHRLPIKWADLDERTRYGILGVYVAQLILSAKRARQKVNLALASIPKAT